MRHRLTNDKSIAIYGSVQAGCDDIMLLKIVETGMWDRAFGDQGSYISGFDGEFEVNPLR